MTKRQRDVVFGRASELHTPVCEVMVPGVCAYTATQWHHRKLRSQGGTNEASGTFRRRKIHLSGYRANGLHYVLVYVQKPVLPPVRRSLPTNLRKARSVPSKLLQSKGYHYGYLINFYITNTATSAKCSIPRYWKISTARGVFEDT